MKSLFLIGVVSLLFVDVANTFALKNKIQTNIKALETPAKSPNFRVSLTKTKSNSKLS